MNKAHKGRLVQKIGTLNKQGWHNSSIIFEFVLPGPVKSFLANYWQVGEDFVIKSELEGADDSGLFKRELACERLKDFFTDNEIVHEDYWISLLLEFAFTIHREVRSGKREFLHVL